MSLGKFLHLLDDGADMRGVQELCLERVDVFFGEVVHAALRCVAVSALEIRYAAQRRHRARALGERWLCRSTETFNCLA